MTPVDADDDDIISNDDDDDDINDGDDDSGDDDTGICDDEDEDDIIVEDEEDSVEMQNVEMHSKPKLQLPQFRDWPHPISITSHLLSRSHTP